MQKRGQHAQRHTSSWSHPFPDSTGNIPRVKALFNKPDANQTLIHLLAQVGFLWRTSALGANGSKVPGVQKVFKPRHNWKLDSFGRETGYRHFVLSHEAIMEK